MQFGILLLVTLLAALPVFPGLAESIQDIGRRLDATTPAEVRRGAINAAVATYEGLETVSKFLWTTAKDAARSIRLKKQLIDARAQRDLAVSNSHLYTPEELLVFEENVKAAEQMFLAVVTH